MKIIAQTFLPLALVWIAGCSDQPASSPMHGNEWSEHIWTEELKQQILSLSQSYLIGKKQYTFSNKYADSPEAASLGKMLFFDTAYSLDGKVACATCHLPEYNFTDPKALSTGIGQTGRHAMGIVNGHYSAWMFWDGRSDSLWSQALGPLEAPTEHGSNRARVARTLYGNKEQRQQYEQVFGSFPDFSDTTRFPFNASPKTGDAGHLEAWKGMSDEDQNTINRIFSNVGKAIAAYEGKLFMTASRFDQFAEAMRIGGENTFLNENELHGLKIFLTKGHCIDCHSGPLFTNNAFHNTGVPQRDPLNLDIARFQGVEDMFADPFNCLGEYSDAPNKPVDCAETRFARRGHDSLKGAFKVPSLRNVAETAPYMNAGQFMTLSEVIDHYNEAPEALVGRSELNALDLTDEEKQYLEEFLQSLTSFVIDPI